MAQDSKATRQRYQIATGGSAGLPAPSKTPRFKAGGNVDSTTFQRYGNGFRKSSGKGKRSC